jgi:adenylylsulfate kinase
VPLPGDTTPAVLLTGLPSSGKTTLGSALVARLRDAGTKAQLLDGDELRRRLPPELGFSRHDREAQAQRAGYIASLLAQHEIVPVLALVLPYAASREQLAAALGPHCLEVHLTAPVATLVARDTADVYRRAVASGDPHYATVIDPYEVPRDPALRLDTSARAVGPCVDQIVGLLSEIRYAR